MKMPPRQKFNLLWKVGKKQMNLWLGREATL